MKLKMLTCLFIFFISSTQGSEKQIWGELASLDTIAIEKSSISFLLEQMPDLKGVEIKLVQINAQYHKNGPSLESLFIHANSFKPISENKTLGVQDLSYGISHYMELIRVEFSTGGIPERISYNEPLLGQNKEESLERFKEFYDSY
ncbi:hypothetical protein [Alteromonas sp. M12]|uniref:hypothetical protein n=1 Tax=Alteromonas sp. M12 TaxID=3135644 RepID=UPI00319E72DA